MAEAVYLLCALTSIACAALLVRSYLATRVRLTLWSALCFVGLALNNVMLYVDHIVVPGADLWLLRTAPAVLGIGVLVAGLVWEST
ncbi:DUF5985 family protein [Anaeromyxobacter sp. Fw109-5]|uniref:DUF5985 family protein n=1 Tax=Anaeromyxobacter sp. (strain Fw109-5) TaxID=404589 RepID=UPI0000ED7B82|nr:DUF5985 family protein [Anaeromyxobacter sp. Fw109-5]ABS24304.1 conserved hypothetical protein [Anaeromyxobacter sp. Fw109-5]